jgi:hypothetical protein
VNGRGRARPGAVAIAALVVGLAGCSNNAGKQSADGAATAASPSPSVITLAPLPPPPEKPATGKLFADLRQSSRDAALGRMEVWIRNDRERDLTPTKVTYVDGRLRQPLDGERLRLNPARSIRGYPLYLPARPACGSDATRGRVVVEHDGRREELPVEDEADVVARFVATTCLRLQVSKVAELSFANEVPVDHEGEGGLGTLVLVVRPSGRPGAGSLTIDTVAGTPLLSSYQEPVWSPDVTVTSTDEEQRIELPVHPARCDEHVFMESGGATAFRVKLHLDVGAVGGHDREGELIVRMDPAGASNAIGYARDSCGYTS